MMTGVINRDELKAQIDAGSVTVVDALGEQYWAKQHLPGAVYLAPDEVATRAASVLPDRHAPIVTYCSSPACSNSQVVATRLEQLGYTNVRKYAAGIEDWVGAALPIESAA